MIIDILPLSAVTARLVRVYSDAPCAVLPAGVTGPGGEAWVITELGDYCFSEKPRKLPEPSETCRYEVAGDGSTKLLETREDLHPLCGNFLEELTLPDSLQVIGSCAFYNCRRLRRLSAGAGELTVGSDVFLNCFALETLVMRAAPEQPTGLFA